MKLIEQDGAIGPSRPAGGDATGNGAANGDHGDDGT
jgi:hypothetical protein